jgi:hypothetical protein
VHAAGLHVKSLEQKRALRLVHFAAEQDEHLPATSGAFSKCKQVR